jgi:hypothetical protein
VVSDEKSFVDVKKAIMIILYLISSRECVNKLLKPPVSTHSNFELNETMHYPAITFCRNPPFKKDVMAVST